MSQVKGAEPLTEAQQELYEWIDDYILEKHHSPSIRQMMRAMGLKSPAPVQSRLEYLRKKGYIDWTEGHSRTFRVVARGDEQLMWVPKGLASAVREYVEILQSEGAIA